MGRLRKRKTARKGEPGVEMRGFERIANFADIFENHLVDVAAGEVEAATKRFAEKVRTIIRSQRYNHVPLSERYLKAKIAKGLDPRILIATETYVSKIRARKVKGANKEVTYRVGPPLGTHKPSGLSFRTLARIHEFGATRKGWKIPARPVWRPAWSAFVREEGPKVVRTVKTKAVKELKKAFKGRR